MEPKTQTAYDRMVAALVDKGYCNLSRHVVANDRNTLAFALWTNYLYVLVLHEYKDGGCALYRSVCEDLGIQNTIDAIP